MIRRLVLPLLLAALVAACESREVENDLRIVDVQTGWYDAGIVEGGMNKLVPSVSFRLENISDRAISSVMLNAVFRRAGEEQAWGEHFVRGIGPEGLEAGETSEPIVLRSGLGYTGTQPRLQMLQNREFVDARVQIFGRHGSRNWVQMNEFPIERQLLTE